MSTETILSARACACTHTHTHRYTDYTNHKLTYNLKRPQTEKTPQWNRKTWQVYFLQKRNALRLDLKESRGGRTEAGRGRSFYAEGPQTEKDIRVNSGNTLNEQLMNYRPC